MREHLGQLCAVMKSSREQYATKFLRKCKHEEIEELKEVGVARKYKSFSLGYSATCPLAHCLHCKMSNLGSHASLVHAISMFEMQQWNSFWKDTRTVCWPIQEELSLLQVPSFGVLTTGVKWLFYKFEPQSKTLYESEPLFLPLERHITASEAQKLALPVVELLLHII